jgi:hypothetical protein
MGYKSRKGRASKKKEKNYRQALTGLIIPKFVHMTFWGFPGALSSRT